MVPMDLRSKWRMAIKDQGSQRSVESNLFKFPQEIRSYDGDEETEPSLWTKQQLSSSKELRRGLADEEQKETPVW